MRFGHSLLFRILLLGGDMELNTDIASGEIFPDYYNIFRKDMLDGYGGVFQATKKDLIITQRSDFDTDWEISWTQCQLANRKAKSILFGSFYHPNVYDIKILYEFDKSLFALGDKLLRHNVIVAGDFNAPNINWENHQVSGNVSTSELLLEIIDKHDLHQLVWELGDNFKPISPQTLFYLIIEILSAVLKSCLV